MNLVKVRDKIYEVKPCLHCKKDEIIYLDEDQPWSDEKWICDNCCSTYVMFNTDIVNDVTIRERRNDILNNI